MLNNKKIQSGSALLFSLLIMSGIVISGLTVGTIVVNELRQSRNLDQSIVAYYAAESGAEKALFAFRQPEVSFGSVVSASPGIANKVDCGYGSAFDPKMCELYWENATAYSFPLRRNQVRQINLFGSNLASGFGVNQISVVSWEDGDPSNGLTPWIEMEVVPLQSDFQNGEAANYVETCCNTLTATLSASYNYKVRLKALYDDIRNVQVLIGGSPAEVTTINIFSSGGFFSAKQAVRVEASSGKQATSLSDFVIFSECDMVKGIGLDSACPL